MPGEVARVAGASVRVGMLVEESDGCGAYRSVWLLERSVPDFDEASDGRLEGREVATVDAALRQPSRKRLQQSLPLIGGPGFGGYRDLRSAERRLLDLDHASHDPDVAQLLTACSACFPCAVSA